jgi:LPS-assembly protein
LPRFPLAHRTGLLLFFLCLFPAVAAAVPALPSLPPGVRVDLTADRLVADAEGRAVAEGDVRLAAGPIRVAAARATYEAETSVLEATGGVTLVSGNIAVRADRIRLDLARREGVLEGAAMFEKTEPPGIEEAAAASLEELRAAGRNVLQVEAERLVIEPEGALVAYDPTVTTCDCGEGEPPSWTVGATKAVIFPGVSLRLHWPVFRARGVPVAAFPYASLPLQRRKTGFLAPTISPSGRLGFGYEQDFFLVLGESYDATLGADYFSGERGEGREGYTSFRGPRARLEFRYAPREGTTGRAFVAYARDLSTDQGPDHPRSSLPVNRWNFALDHADDWGRGFSDRIHLGILTDRRYLTDFTDSVILRGEQVTRSTAWFGHRSAETLVVGDALFVQDLRDGSTSGDGGGVGSPTTRLFGAGARRPFQRIPGLALDLVHLPAGPAELALRVGVARYAPLEGVSFDDVGADGLGPGDYAYPGPDAGEGDRIFGPGETSSTTRLSLRPGISVPLVLGRYLSVVPHAGYRLQLYENDHGPDGERSWGVFGAAARTELSRTFGEGERRLRHAIGPRFEFRHLVPVAEEHAAGPFDEFDVGPGREETQGRVSLWQRLSGRSKLGTVAVELEVGEDLLLTPERERWEDFAELGATVGPARASLRLRLDPETFSTREVLVRTGLETEYASLGFDYSQLARGASARLLAGPDELFATRPRLPLLGAVELYEPEITVRPWEGLSVSWGSAYLAPLDEWIQQTLGVTYTSACRCWSVGFRLAYRYPAPMYPDLPNFGDFSFDLGGLVRL